MQLMMKSIKCRMDTLVHHWGEANKSLVKVIFLFDESVANDLSDKGVIKVSLKISHISAVKALREDLFVAALWDHRE